MRAWFVILWLLASCSCWSLDFRDYIPTSDGVISQHITYVCCYSPVTNQCVWSMGKLSPGRHKNYERPDVPFAVCSVSASVPSSNYNNLKDIHRGHMWSAQDAENSLDSINELDSMNFSDTVAFEAVIDTFHTCNICPQKGTHNTGIWKKLENETRDGSFNSETWVIRGPIHTANSASVGKIPMPMAAAFFQVSYKPDTKECLAWIIPHDTPKGSQTISYITTIEAVEKATNIIFNFPNRKRKVNNAGQKSKALTLKTSSEYEYNYLKNARRLIAHITQKTESDTIIWEVK